MLRGTLEKLGEKRFLPLLLARRDPRPASQTNDSGQSIPYAERPEVGEARGVLVLVADSGFMGVALIPQSRGLQANPRQPGAVGRSVAFSSSSLAINEQVPRIARALNRCSRSSGPGIFFRSTEGDTIRWMHGAWLRAVSLGRGRYVRSGPTRVPMPTSLHRSGGSIGSIGSIGVVRCHYAVNGIP